MILSNGTTWFQWQQRFMAAFGRNRILKCTFFAFSSKGNWLP